MEGGDHQRAAERGENCAGGSQGSVCLCEEGEAAETQRLACAPDLRFPGCSPQIGLGQVMRLFCPEEMFLTQEVRQPRLAPSSSSAVCCSHSLLRGQPNPQQRPCPRGLLALALRFRLLLNCQGPPCSSRLCLLLQDSLDGSGMTWTARNLQAPMDNPREPPEGATRPGSFSPGVLLCAHSVEQNRRPQEV